MKAVGYVRCKICQGLYRGYKPRSWKPGNDLATWQHTEEDAHHGYGRNARCEGSYKAGYDTHLDADIHKNETPT